MRIPSRRFGRQATASVCSIAWWPAATKNDPNKDGARARHEEDGWALTEVWFYHLERSELEAALPPLLEKCLERGWRALVRGGSSERLEALDAHLWTFRDDSFVPHAIESGRIDAARQPVLLTTNLGNPNGAKALFLIDGAEIGDLQDFERVCLVFDGRDENALNLARSKWKEVKAAGETTSYWRENANGKWEKNA